MDMVYAAGIMVGGFTGNWLPFVLLILISFIGNLLEENK